MDYNEFKKYKDIYDLSDYIKDIEDNTRILEEFDRKKAIDQIQKLTRKYYIEINTIALAFKNNMFVVPVVLDELTNEKLKNDIKYINSLIPAIAIARESCKKL